MKLDKSHFIIQNFNQASEHQEKYRVLSSDKKKEVFFYLMQVAFGFVGKPWPQMDKTYFKIKKR
jgi:hypothetical protein